jgi:hypothetical protein
LQVVEMTDRSSHDHSSHHSSHGIVKDEKRQEQPVDEKRTQSAHI